jgi:chemotaxis signal transduction protein
MPGTGLAAESRCLRTDPETCQNPETARCTVSTLVRIIECLQFESSGRSFCVDVDQVLGLISLPPHLREAPPVIPFHGGLIPVVSLERILEIEEKPRFSPPEVVVLRDEPDPFGIAVDWVGEIHKVPVQRSMFRFPESSRSRIKMFGIWGMVNLNHKIALILEPLTLIHRLRSQPQIAEGSATPRPADLEPEITGTQL